MSRNLNIIGISNFIPAGKRTKFMFRFLPEKHWCTDLHSRPELMQFQVKFKALSEEVLTFFGPLAVQNGFLSHVSSREYAKHSGD